MKNPIASALFVVMLAISVVSCVSSKKYRELQTTSRQNMIDRDNYKAENMTLEMKNKEIEKKISALEEEMSKIRQELSLAEIERNRAKEDLNVITGRYNDLQIAQEDLIRGNVTETKKLLTDLQAAQVDLKQKEDILRQLEQSMDIKKVALDELTLELEKKNARMAELEKILDSQKRIVQDLKNNGQLKDNWDLSVKRATTVVRVLLEGSKIKPGRLTAAGRSEYFPVDATNTDEARQKNRRTEIILTPDLTELYDLINKY